MRRLVTALAPPALALAYAACSSGGSADPLRLKPGGAAGAGGSAGPGLPAELGAVPLDATVVASAGLSAPVEVVRDEGGVPHIYAEAIADAAFAQGYVTANDRFVQMDIFRRNASGTLSELVGTAALPDDIDARVHHLRATAEGVWSALQASADPADRELVAVLRAYAAGVNAWVDELKAGKHKAPQALVDSLVYDPQFVPPWSEVDSIAVGELQAFGLSFDVDTELVRTAEFARDSAVFKGSADPALAKRAGLAADLNDLRPFRATFTVDGWPEAVAGPPPAARAPGPGRAPDAALVGLIGRVLPASGRLPAFGSGGARGSNNWVIAGRHTKSGRPLLANDTHLSLTNPSLFYLVHLTANDGLDVMGVQFPGAPLVTLGFNRHVAWGSTVSYLDVTDVYDETIAPCPSDPATPCATFRGEPVPLVARDETFRVGLAGNPALTSPVTVRLYDVPHHGPLLPRVRPDGTVEPPGARELSVRYTGHEGYPIFRAFSALDRAKSAAEAVDAIERHLAYGRQNWVFADDAGAIAWTQATRLPRRPAGAKPWLVLPGDGTAEWEGYVDPKSLPRSVNPAKGYLVTANADPIGVTADNDPLNDGPGGDRPGYLGVDFDPGARVHRITARIEQAIAAGDKLDADAMASIQADAVAEFGRSFGPAFVEGARALAEQAARPDAHPELAPVVAAAPAPARAFYDQARALVESWTFDTPAGTEPGADPRAVDDSRATLLVAAFTTRLAAFTLRDEFDRLADPAAEFAVPLGGSAATRLLPRLLEAPEELTTRDALFDDLTTPDVVETRLMILARAASEAIAWAFSAESLGADPAAWRWGAVHTVKPAFFLPVGGGALDQPKAYPRHGWMGTVDVADPGVSDDRYTYRVGSAIRFVCEVDPDRGPVARNVLPGGQVYDAASPHYADQLELWAQNKALDLPYALGAVVEAAKRERAANALGRLRFEPQGAP
jgi:penicillin amidase